MYLNIYIILRIQKNMLISKTFKFDAAHKIPNYNGKCSQLHGHTWKLVITLEGEIKRSEEHTSVLQSHSEVSYAVFCLKKKKRKMWAGQYMEKVESRTNRENDE